MPDTLRLLGQFWLEEVGPKEVPVIAGLPELAASLPAAASKTLTELAVEYQRLFGFNLPPYESVFVDPSAMLMAPATARVQALYQQADWLPPPGLRFGAPDHLGVELLALAAWQESGQTDEAYQLLTRHLALWVPAFILSLQRLAPAPFYRTLAGLTLDHLLAGLPANTLSDKTDPFPNLPPPPVYKSRGLPLPDKDHEEEEESVRLRDIVNHLLTPCRAGLYLTRDDIGRISRTLELPPVLGERRRMLETLFRLAGQYDVAPALIDQLNQLFAGVGVTYTDWAKKYPTWTPYASAWQQRVTSAQTMLEEMAAALP